MAEISTNRIVNLPEAAGIDDGMNFVTDSLDGSGTRRVPYGMLRVAVQESGAVNLAPAYDPEETYEVGDTCTYQGVLYECTTAVTTPEAWNQAKWTSTNMEVKLNEIKTEMSKTGLEVVNGMIYIRYEEE